MFTFVAEVWLWPGTSPWHLISLPEDLADLIAASSTGRERRFGSVPVEVMVTAHGDPSRSGVRRHCSAVTKVWSPRGESNS